jgi:putrescine transport system permease protein
MTTPSQRPTMPRRLAPRPSVLLPYLWLGVFFAIPFLIVLKISFATSTIAQPPYEPVLDLAAGWQGLKDFLAGLTIENYTRLIGDEIYLYSYLKSLQIAAISTVILLMIGYPVAYALARAPRGIQPVLLLLIVLPFWVSLLIRVYAWMTILQRDGLLNQLLMTVGLIDEPATWLASDTAVYIGLVYSYFPFMVLPLYAALERLDDSLLEAAADLGSPPWKSFWQITVPLSLPGVAAGALLCFIPIVGEFVIPDLLAGSSSMMIGQTLWLEFFTNKDWPVAAAGAVALLVMLVPPLLLYDRLQRRTLAGGA